MVKFQFLAEFPVDHLPTQLCQVLYSFWDSLLRLLIMWLIVFSLSPHNLYLLFCCELSILALIWLALMALFCAAIWRDSVSFLRFSLLSHVQIFSCEMLFIRRLKRTEVCFSSHFCFLVIIVLVCLLGVSIVSGDCNQRAFLCYHRVVVSIPKRGLQSW